MNTRKKSSDSLDKLSCSMIIDSGDNKQSNDLHKMSLQPRKLKKWINDSDVKKCYYCNIKFSMLRRKHHCRACGRIFCYQCCNEWINLDKDKKVIDKKLESKSKKYIEKWLYGNGDRICILCKDKMNCLQKKQHLDIIFSYLNLNDIKYAGYTCTEWKEVAAKYFSEFRYIQYYFYDHIFTKREKRLLWMHRKSFCGHSKLIIQLIKSQADNINSNIFNEMINIINQNRVIKCKYLYCSRNCNKHIKPIEILELLEYDSIYIKQLVATVLDCCGDEELNLYLPLLISHIIKNEYIEKLITKRSMNNIKIRFNYFCLLECYSNNNINYIKIKRDFLKNIESCFDYITLINTISFIKKLENIVSIYEKCNDIIVEIKKLFKKYDKDIYCPINPNYIITKIKYDQINIKNSATKPVYIPLICKNNQEYKEIDIIIKKEDVRKDQIIINIIDIIDKILDSNGIDRNICIYKIQPISSKVGIIEIVKDAETIYNIIHKKKFTIQNYINENNPDKKISEIQKKFLISVSSYCVITYLLGVGDRHLNNIMITRDGTLFHIDYGYIMGVDPKYKGLTDSMKITPDMINTIGGVNSKNYEIFKLHSSRIYNCLRRYISIFFIMLSPLAYLENNTMEIRNNINQEIIKRFTPNITYKEAEIKVYNIIGDSQSSYSHKLIDRMYYMGRENMLFTNVNSFTGYLSKFFDFFL